MVDTERVLVFYNEAAGALLGKRFEETGRLTREQWNEIGPVDLEGNPIASGDLPLTVALREGRPSHGRFNICTDERNDHRGGDERRAVDLRRQLSRRDGRLLAGGE